MLTLLQLVKIRLGPGAAVLPQDVTRIHLEFAHKFNGGHMGSRCGFSPALAGDRQQGLHSLGRKFWRDALPRLKYWNPAIPMVVNRSTNQEGPATLTLYFREPGAAFTSDIPQPSSSTEGSSKAPAPAEGERVVTIDMKNRLSDAILKEFIDKSGAVAVKPTPQDEIDLRNVEEWEAQGEVDGARVKARNELIKREKRMLAAAHSEAAAIKAAAAA